MIIDFFDLNGAWVDCCEAWQVDTLLPRLQMLFGAVTMRERGQVAEVVADDFATWLASV